MAEELLDDAQVRAALEHVRGEGVAQRVRARPLRQPGASDKTVDPEAQATGPQRLAARPQEQRIVGRALRSRRALRGDRRLRGQQRAGVAQVGIEGIPRRAAEHPQTLLATLAQDADLAACHIHVDHPDAGDLADPQPGGIGALDDGAVTQLERLGQRGQPRSRHGMTARARDDIEEPLDIFHREHARQARRAPRCDDRGPGVAIDPALPAGEAIERAQRGDAAGDRRAGQAAPVELGEVRAQGSPRRSPPVHTRDAIEPGRGTARSRCDRRAACARRHPGHRARS